MGSSPQGAELGRKEDSITPDKAEFTDMSIFPFYSIYILARNPGDSANRLLGWF